MSLNPVYRDQLYIRIIHMDVIGNIIDQLYSVFNVSLMLFLLRSSLPKP